MVEAELTYYTRRFAYLPVRMADDSWRWRVHYYIKYTVFLWSPVRVFYFLMSGNDGIKRIAEIKSIRISAEEYTMDRLHGITEGPEIYRPPNQDSNYLQGE